MDKLLEANEILVPTALIERECENLQKQMTEAGQLQGGMSMPKELFEGEAKRRVGLGLVMSEVIKSAELKPDAERVDAKIKDISLTYEDPQEVINHYSNNPQLKQGIEGLVMEEMVVDWIVEQASVSEKASSFKAMMNPEPEK